MTGITRVSKESIFSYLNNMTVVTSTSNQYAASFGFTEAEVFDALNKYGMRDKQKKLIRESGSSVKTTMEDLLEGKSFHTEIDEQLIFDRKRQIMNL